jgi:membrane-associated phospholipid phosphatase
MHWLQTLDGELFRLVNSTIANPVCDVLMPLISGNSVSFPFFYAALFLSAVVLAVKNPSGAFLFLLMLAATLAVSDGLVSNTLKHAVARERPFLVLPDVRCLVGKGGSGSMPSSHASNWFAAAMVGFIYYRRSAWLMLPAASLVAFSRVYNGVHYPSDVLAGALLGAGSAGATLWLLQSVWTLAGRRWFPLWWQKLPSLLTPPPKVEPEEGEAEDAPPEPLPRTRGIAPTGFRPPHVTVDEHWLRIGYLCIAVLLIARWVYIAGGTIQLAEDEAYQWVWSKQLALSYYSKPPLIAYTQFLGTSLWGDNAFGVRFFSPLITAVMSLVILRFFAREVNARAGFFLVLIVTAAPMLAVGAVLMTVDPLSVMFWTAAMLAGWRAIQERGTSKDWVWVGLWMGLGFLSKYTELVQWVSWALVFILWAPARKQLRRPGPYLALLLNLVLALPVLLWNCQHQWVTVTHVAETGDVGKEWELSLRYVGEFFGAEAGLLNPIFSIAMLWAAIAFWRRGRQNSRAVYFFCMGAPVFLIYLVHSFHARVLPNWIAPSVLPLFCLMVMYWDTRFRLGVWAVKMWLVAGLILGFATVLFFHNTNLYAKLTGHYLPVKLDPLHRVREWDTTARVVDQARQQLLTEGKPAFIITDHYGMAGQLSFYLPEARTNVQSNPLVYCRSTAQPENQFYFLPGYAGRKGQNAIYVLELNRDKPTPRPPPERLLTEFESVTSLGVTNVPYHGQYLLRPLQLYACRGLK